MTTHYILLINCTDRKGLIHNITGVLYHHGLNIVSNGEFVDQKRKLFFMRTEFSGTLHPEQIVTELKTVLPDGADIQLPKRQKRDVIIMASKEFHCLGDLLSRYAFDDLGANVLAVISNHTTLKDYVQRFGIPYHYVSHTNKMREEHEARIIKIIDKYSPDYIVLAKYMRVFTPAFVSHYKNQIVNIHHSFLPAFTGASPYKQAFDRGVKIIGATAHFVNEDLDNGPIITQDITPVDHTYSAEDMGRAGRDVEKVVLAKALKLVFEDRVFINGNKTIVFG